jgi:hypothetical protein
MRNVRRRDENSRAHPSTGYHPKNSGVSPTAVSTSTTTKKTLFIRSELRGCGFAGMDGGISASTSWMGFSSALGPRPFALVSFVLNMEDCR